MVNLSQINKKMMVMVGLSIVLLIIFMIVISIITKDRSLEFPAIEQRLIQGAEKYYKNNPDLLPKEEGGKTVISINTLENEKYIPALSKMVKGDVICNAEVRVANNNGYYLYSPYLNCGNAYTTKELYKLIVEPEKIVTEDDGLYKIGDEYIFRGIPKTNFVEFAGQMWQILKVDKDNDIKLIQYETKYTYLWDNRYNINRTSNEGINAFFKSRLERELVYMLTEIIGEKDRKFIVSKPFCIGKRSDGETDKREQVECQEKSKPLPVGLINVSEFLIASLDQNCQKTYDASCQNYNYLAREDYSWWTITGQSENTYRAYTISGSTVSDDRCNRQKRLRSVVYLSSDVVLNSGTGTYRDPYIIK